jgi:hypothetical protein
MKAHHDQTSSHHSPSGSREPWVPLAFDKNKSPISFPVHANMKTPTLIVRLIGLYLLQSNIFALIQLRNVASVPPGAIDPASGIRIYVYVSLIIALVAVVFAGHLAHLLTIDTKE